MKPRQPRVDVTLSAGAHSSIMPTPSISCHSLSYHLLLPGNEREHSPVNGFGVLISLCGELGTEKF